MRETVHILEYGQVEIRGILGGPWFVYTRSLPSELVTSERFFTNQEAIDWVKKNKPYLLHVREEVKEDDDDLCGWEVTI